ncbi:hypothetical protein JKP88DRAFT_315912 [Tribonema minus]|uniref:Uncharacterized protein n=1 Tax=Tribonema minus TaxID=303371 RepID=A0A836CG00_9STRA|nr:hypothetical protein JKP88DRAFT_315912 [Tribonema minus]
MATDYAGAMQRLLQGTRWLSDGERRQEMIAAAARDNSVREAISRSLEGAIALKHGFDVLAEHGNLQEDAKFQLAQELSLVSGWIGEVQSALGGAGHTEPRPHQRQRPAPQAGGAAAVFGNLVFVEDVLSHLTVCASQQWAYIAPVSKSWCGDAHDGEQPEGVPRRVLQAAAMVAVQRLGDWCERWCAHHQKAVRALVTATPAISLLNYFSALQEQEDSEWPWWFAMGLRNVAVRSGDLATLQWLTTHNGGALFSQDGRGLNLTYYMDQGEIGSDSPLEADEDDEDRLIEDASLLEAAGGTTFCFPFKDGVPLAPMHIAAYYGHVDIMEWLHSQGVEIDEFVAKMAALKGQLTVLQFVHHELHVDGCGWGNWTSQSCRDLQGEYVQGDLHKLGCPCTCERSDSEAPAAGPIG